MVSTAAYANLDAFLQENAELLAAREAENSILLGHALQAKNNPDYWARGRYWSSVLSTKGPDLLASVMPPQPLLLAAVGEAAMAAAGHLARALRAGGWQIAGVLGRDTVAVHFAKQWTGLTGAGWQARRQLRVYELRAGVDGLQSRGKLRTATGQDVGQVARWVEAFEKEALGRHEAAWDAEAYARRRIAAGEIAIWDDGGPAAMAGHARPTLHGITINLVYTPAELRGRGYAGACVATLSRQLLEQGRQFCTLSADLANPTANRVYQRIGYTRVCDFEHIVFET